MTERETKRENEMKKKNKQGVTEEGDRDKNRIKTFPVTCLIKQNRMKKCCGFFFSFLLYFLRFHRTLSVKGCLV